MTGIASLYVVYSPVGQGGSGQFWYSVDLSSPAREGIRPPAVGFRGITFICPNRADLHERRLTA
jgi:hypothetical protein